MDIKDSFRFFDLNLQPRERSYNCGLLYIVKMFGLYFLQVSDAFSFMDPAVRWVS